MEIYDLALASSTVYAPGGTESPSGNYSTIGFIVQAVAPVLSLGSAPSIQPGIGPQTLTVTPAHVGDCVIFVTQTSSSPTISSTALSSTNVTWDSAPMFSYVSGYLNIQIWKGVATSTSSAVVTPTWSASVTGVHIELMSMGVHSSVACDWKLLPGASGGTSGTTASSALVSAASLTSGSGDLGEFYFGYMYSSPGAAAGTTPGFTYYIDAYGNGEFYDLVLAPSTAYTPNITNSGSGAWDIASVIVQAVTPYDAYLESLSPVGWWKLADAVGASSAIDSSGNSFNLTKNGTITFGQTTPSQISPETGALFDGTSGYLIGTMTSTQAAVFSGSFTVAAWVNTSNWSPTSDVEFFGAGGTSYATDHLFQLFIDGNNYSGGGLAIGFYGDDWGSGFHPSAGWHFVVATVSRGASTSVRTLYVDGVSKGSNTSTGNLTVSSGNFLEIGREPAVGNYWPGDIAQVAIFNSVLTSTEISTLYSGGVASYTVTFNANGGSGTMSPETASSATALTLNTFTRTGYAFNGWNTAADGSGTSYADGASYPFTSSITLYAQWAVVIYHPTGFPLSTGSDSAACPAPTSYTMPHAYGAIGDLAIFAPAYFGTVNPTISSITGTQSGTWTLRERLLGYASENLDIWTAPVTATASADVLSITYAGSTAGGCGDFWGDSLSSGFGASTVWSFPASGSTEVAKSTTFSYPALLSATTSDPQAYWGHGVPSGVASGGTTPGFSYLEGGGFGQEQIYDLSIASNTTYTPTSTATSSGGSNNANDLTVGIIIRASSEVTGVASVTAGALSVSSSSKKTVKGTASVGAGGLSIASTGKVTVKGTASVSAGSVSLSSTSKRSTFATASVALGAVSVHSNSVDAVSGHASVTAGTLTIASSSKRTVKGSASVGSGALNLSAASKKTVSSTASVTLGSVSFSSNGTTTVLGVASAPLGTLTIASSSKRTVKGTSSLSVGNLSLTASSGAYATVRIGSLTVAATGKRTELSAASIPIGGLSVASTGQDTVRGTASVGVGGLSLTSAGKRTVNGTTHVSAGNLSLSSTSKRSTFATSNISVGSLSLHSNSLDAVSGYASVAVGSLSIASSSKTTVTGTASVPYRSLSITSSSKKVVFGSALYAISALSVHASSSGAKNGTANVSVGNLGLASTSKVTVRGVVSAVLGALRLAFSGAAPKTGVSSVLIGALSAAAFGKTTALGSTSIGVGGVSLSSSSRRTVIGTADTTIGAASVELTSKRTATGRPSIVLGPLDLASRGGRVVAGASALQFGNVTISSSSKRSVFSRSAASMGPTYLTATGQRVATGYPQVTLSGLELSSLSVVTSTSPFTHPGAVEFGILQPKTSLLSRANKIEIHTQSPSVSAGFIATQLEASVSRPSVRT
jgi:uncharacterized repeat protein (TIGR02543 family)